jgi:hypothetical protein
MRHLWRSWRQRRLAKRALKLLEQTQPFKASPGMLSQKETETKPQSEITGFYQNLQGMLQDAIDTKKRTQASADRITNAIGAAPPEPKKKKE